MYSLTLGCDSFREAGAQFVKYDVPIAIDGVDKLTWYKRKSTLLEL